MNNPGGDFPKGNISRGTYFFRTLFYSRVPSYFVIFIIGNILASSYRNPKNPYWAEDLARFFEFIIGAALINFVGLLVSAALTPRKANTLSARYRLPIEIIFPVFWTIFIAYKRASFSDILYFWLMTAAIYFVSEGGKWALAQRKRKMEASRT